MKKSSKSSTLFLFFSFILFVSCDSQTEIPNPILTTSTVSSITTISATSGGVITLEGGSNVTSRGVCWSTNPKPTIADSKTTDSLGVETYESLITDLKMGTTYFVRAYATNSFGTGYGNEIQFSTLNIFNSDLNYGTAIDIDGNIYKTIKIGTQTWMAENLRTTTYNDGTSIPWVIESFEWMLLDHDGYSWCNNDTTSKNNGYGAWYNGYAVKTGKLAPVGWHVATNSDWSKLYSYVSENLGASVYVQKALASTVGWPASTVAGSVGNNPSLNNSSGFSALPGGCRSSNGASFSHMLAGFWLTSDNYGGDWYMYCWSTCENDMSNGISPIKQGVSVRCVKD